jgi:hypothetical protein
VGLALINGIPSRKVAFALILGVTAAAIAIVAIPADSVRYFPPSLATKAACGLPVVSDFEAEWYGSALRAAHEAPLYGPLSTTGTTATYRFTWLRSFHHPIIIRVDERSSGVRILTAKGLSGAGGYAKGVIDNQLVRPLSQAEGAKFHSLLTTTHVLDLAATDCHAGADGAPWIIEAQTRDGYRYVNRWSPQDGPVRDVGVLLLGFTGWHVDPVY